MGMIGNLVRVSNERLENFKTNSAELEKLVYSEESVSAPWYMDLDKTWEAIHFILSRKSLAESEMNGANNSELGSVIFNSQIIDEEQDLGYGPASYNTPNQVETLTTKLNSLNVSELEEKFDGTKLNNAGVYPEIWDEIESKEYVFDNLKSLIKFFNEASNNKEAIISFIN